MGGGSLPTRVASGGETRPSLLSRQLPHLASFHRGHIQWVISSQLTREAEGGRCSSAYSWGSSLRNSSARLAGGAYGIRQGEATTHLRSKASATCHAPRAKRLSTSSEGRAYSTHRTTGSYSSATSPAPVGARWASVGVPTKAGPLPSQPKVERIESCVTNVTTAACCRCSWRASRSSGCTSPRVPKATKRTRGWGSAGDSCRRGARRTMSMSPPVHVPCPI